MSEQNTQQEQANQESDFEWNQINFPKSIGQLEARKICRYLVSTLEGECYVSLHTDKHETFGQRFTPKPKTLGEVPLTLGDVNLTGSITRTDNVTMVEFAFLKEYDQRDRLKYQKLRLSIGVYDWDEISKDSRALVTDIRSQVENYFQEPKR